MTMVYRTIGASDAGDCSFVTYEAQCGDTENPTGCEKFETDTELSSVTGVTLSMPYAEEQCRLWCLNEPHCEGVVFKISTAAPECWMRKHFHKGDISVTSTTHKIFILNRGSCNRIERDTEGCLVAHGAVVYLVHNDNTRSRVFYAEESPGCRFHALQIQDISVYPPRYDGKDAFWLNQEESKIACSRPACDRQCFAKDVTDAKVSVPL